MSIKDIVNNIKLAYYKTCIETKDAFDKKRIEDKFKELGISYLTGFNDNAYQYVVVGVKGNKNDRLDKLAEFLLWFKGDGKLKYKIGKHKWFRTKIYCFSR
ncbi:MAG: hypothetical protein ILA11_11065 [Butyrivibrio sp.]|nr:hypothetical protein [Butyrivibrio sp.]